MLCQSNFPFQIMNAKQYISFQVKKADEFVVWVVFNYSVVNFIAFTLNFFVSAYLVVSFNFDVKFQNIMLPSDHMFLFFSSRLCIPHLKKGKNPHILTISPPLNMKQSWFEMHVGKA